MFVIPLHDFGSILSPFVSQLARLLSNAELHHLPKDHRDSALQVEPESRAVLYEFEVQVTSYLYTVS